MIFFHRYPANKIIELRFPLLSKPKLKEKLDNSLKELSEELESDKAQTKLKRAKLEIFKDFERAKKLVPKEKEIIRSD